MSEVFDPYLRWLGIRDPQRPPNHYRLLGLDLFESDVDVIASAADRQMAHVRSFQTGQYAELSQKILNELAAARVCLLKPDRKAAYDADLRKSAAPKAMPKPVAAAQPVAAAKAAPRPVAAAVATKPVAAPAAEFPSFGDAAPSRRRSAAAKKKKSSPALPILIGLLATITVAVIVVWNAKSKAPETARSKPTAPVTPEKVTAEKPETDDSNKPKDENADSKPPEPEKTPVKPVVIEPAIESPDEPGDSESDAPEETTEESDTSDPSAKDSDETADDEEMEEDSPDEPAGQQELPEVPAEPKDSRLPVPEKDAQAAALAIIKDLFKTEFAARKPEERAAFARKLLEQARESANDATAAYVLYDQAVSIAASLGDADTALQASEALGKQYQVDPFEIHATTLTTLSRTAKTSDASKAIGQRSSALTEEAIAVDRYDMAKRFNSLALSAARKAKDLGLLSSTQTRSREIMALEAEYGRAELAFKTLEDKPDDPEANYAAGRFICFLKRDFGRGLRHLAKGSEKELRELATSDLACSDEGAELVSVADRWWAMGESLREVEKANVVARAVEQYQRALPNLKGLSRQIVTSRIKEYESQYAPRASVKNPSPVLRQLVSTVWQIHWSNGAVHSNVTMNADGNWAANEFRGKWEWLGNRAVIKYRDYIDYYYVEGNQLRTEHFNSNENQATPVAVGTGKPQ